jgi:5-methylcytosine-specific restriction enzyme A
MGLGDLDDPRAVREAMAEFDRLGREAFLTRYGFGPARGYFVIEGGRRYDSKAIAGAAHGHQFPERGPLSPADFSGGERSVGVRLERLGFAVEGPPEEGRRNPPWTRDELVLSLDLYLRHRPTILDDRHPEVIELSDLLGKLAALEGGASDAARFRNPNGVGMKLANLARLDPEAASRGRRGLAHGGRGEEEVWRDLAGNPIELRAAADAIRAAVKAGEIFPPARGEEDEGQEEASEGRVLTRLHRVRERSRDLVRRRKERALARHGRLACEACGFDPAGRYGERGRGLIECHHTRPVHTLRPGEATRLDDLALLCANCHRAVHARRPWLSLDELRAVLAAASNVGST